MSDQQSICLNCLYGCQPFGYYPFVCVHGKRAVTLYHDKAKCKHFEPCPEETTDDADSLTSRMSRFHRDPTKNNNNS